MLKSIIKILPVYYLLSFPANFKFLIFQIKFKIILLIQNYHIWILVEMH